MREFFYEQRDLTFQAAPGQRAAFFSARRYTLGRSVTISNEPIDLGDHSWPCFARGDCLGPYVTCQFRVSVPFLFGQSAGPNDLAEWLKNYIKELRAADAVLPVAGLRNEAVDHGAANERTVFTSRT